MVWQSSSVLRDPASLHISIPIFRVLASFSCRSPSPERWLPTLYDKGQSEKERAGTGAFFDVCFYFLLPEESLSQKPPAHAPTHSPQVSHGQRGKISSDWLR